MEGARSNEVEGVAEEFVVAVVELVTVGVEVIVGGRAVAEGEPSSHLDERERPSVQTCLNRS